MKLNKEKKNYFDDKPNRNAKALFYMKILLYFNVFIILYFNIP